MEAKAKRYMDYYVSEGKEKIEKDLNQMKHDLRAWKSVKRAYKKDGKPFCNLMKNFTAGEDHFRVSLRLEVPSYGLGSYKIVCYAYAIDDEGYSSGRYYEHDTVWFEYTEPSPDEVMEKINIRISQLENDVEKYQKKLDNLEKAFCEFTEAMIQARAIADKYDLKYELGDYFKNTFNYIV